MGRCGACASIGEVPGREERQPMRVLEGRGEHSWEFHILAPERWGDFEELFGEHGAAGGCWCMWWRLTKRKFDAQKGEANHRAMKAIVDSGRVPGFLTYYREHPYRQRGVATKLLKAAVEYVRDNGGRIVEGYPVEPQKDRMPDLFAYHGLASMFPSIGFKEVARRSERRPIMRYMIGSYYTVSS